jgi:prophage regulatory protein
VKAALEEPQCEALHHQNAVEETRKCAEVPFEPYIFIKLPKVKALTTLSASEIYRRIAAGTFPKQVVLGPKSVVWIEAEVLAWCEVCISESREDVF